MHKDLLLEDLTAIDNKLSQRYIELDPNGYFIIYIDPNEKLIYAKHFTNVINERFSRRSRNRSGDSCAW
jgi:hypothetical protein